MRNEDQRKEDREVAAARAPVWLHRSTLGPGASSTWPERRAIVNRPQSVGSTRLTIVVPKKKESGSPRSLFLETLSVAQSIFFSLIMSFTPCTERWRSSQPFTKIDGVPRTLALD